MSTVAWTGWVTLVMAVALTTTNPLYLAIVLLTVVLVALVSPKNEGSGLGIRYMLVLGVALCALSIGVAVINTGSGEHVLFSLPQFDAPDKLGGLSLGGDVTGEAVVGGAIRGTVILSVLLGFAVFSAAVSPHAVLRLAPAVLFHAGLVITIGLALLPSTLADLRRIREMQALRGRSTGIRSLAAIAVPVVMAGLDRAMRFAEAMEARGYASPPRIPAAKRLLGMASAPLLIASAWIWFYYADLRWISVIVSLLGVAALVGWGWDVARRQHTTRLNVEPEAPALFLLGRVSFVLAAGLVLADLAGWLPTSYNPFAGLPAPEFGVVGALLAIAPAWPLAFLTSTEARAHQGPTPEPVLQ